MKAGWRKRKLSEVLEIQNGYAFNSKQFVACDGMPLIRIRDLRGGWSTETNFEGEFDERYRVRAGDFLIGMDGEFGCYEWRGPDALLNQRVCKLTEFASDIDARFLFYGINSHLKAIEDATTYTTVKHLSSKQIHAIEFLFPPIEEQRRIVAVLDEAFAAIATATANAEKNLANARDLFASELDALIVEAQRSYPSGPLIEQCVGMTVGHVGPMKDRYQAEGIPFLRSQNVRPFEISFDGMMFIDKQFDSELKKSRLRPGDVAVVRTGYPGTAAVIPSTLLIANCSDLVIIRPGKALNPHFVAAFLNSNVGKRAVSGELVGAAQKHFNVGSAKMVAIPLPSLEQQAILLDRVSAFSNLADQLIELSKSRIRQLSDLKAAIACTAFNGMLTASIPETIAA